MSEKVLFDEYITVLKGFQKSVESVIEEEAFSIPAKSENGYHTLNLVIAEEAVKRLFYPDITMFFASASMVFNEIKCVENSLYEYEETEDDYEKAYTLLKSIKRFSASFNLYSKALNDASKRLRRSLSVVAHTKNLERLIAEFEKPLVFIDGKCVSALYESGVCLADERGVLELFSVSDKTLLLNTKTNDYKDFIRRLLVVKSKEEIKAEINEVIADYYKENEKEGIKLYLQTLLIYTAKKTGSLDEKNLSFKVSNKIASNAIYTNFFSLIENYIKASTGKYEKGYYSSLMPNENNTINEKNMLANIAVCAFIIHKYIDLTIIDSYAKTYNKALKITDIGKESIR